MAILSTFTLLPELLYRTQRLRDKDAIQKDWADFLIHNDNDEHYQALRGTIPPGRENYSPRLASGNPNGSA